MVDNASTTLTIELAAQDNVASMLSRLRAAAGERVLFVVPRELNLTEVDLRVLRRDAASRGQGLALVTSEPDLRAAAGRVGISTFRSIDGGETARWRTLRPDRFRPGRPVGPADALPPAGPGLYARRLPSGVRGVAFLRAFVRRENPWWGTLFLALVLVALMAFLLVALADVIPAAVVKVTPANEPIEVTVPLRAVVDATADPQTGIVPARQVSVVISGEGQMPTTGKRYDPSAKATGRVKFTNRTGLAVDVPEGTIVFTATGDNQRFHTILDGRVEANGQTSLPIEAELPGDTANVRAGTITEIDGPLSLSLLVTNDAPTTGGGSSQVAVVAEEDKATLQAQVFEDLKKKAYDRLNERLPAGSFVPAETVSYLAMSPTFSPFVGDVSPDLFLDMSVQAVGLVVDTSSGNTSALDRLQRSMPPGSRLIADSVRYIPGSVKVESDKAVSFSVTAHGTLLRGVDPGTARNLVLGMAPEEAGQALTSRFALGQAPQISLGPDWLPVIVPTHIPSVPWRIRVIVDWDAAARLAVATP